MSVMLFISFSLNCTWIETVVALNKLRHYQNIININDNILFLTHAVFFRSDKNRATNSLFLGRIVFLFRLLFLLSSRWCLSFVAEFSLLPKWVIYRVLSRQAGLCVWMFVQREFVGWKSKNRGSRVSYWYKTFYKRLNINLDLVGSSTPCNICKVGQDNVDQKVLL